MEFQRPLATADRAAPRGSLLAPPRGLGLYGGRRCDELFLTILAQGRSLQISNIDREEALQHKNGGLSRASTRALWFLVAAATAFLGGLCYLTFGLLKAEDAHDHPNYQYERTDPTVRAPRAEDDGEGADDRREQRAYERLKADAEHRLGVLSWQEARAGVSVTDANVDVARYTARVALLGAIIAGVGTLLSAVAAAVAALALSDGRRSTTAALMGFVDERRAQRAFLSCRLEAGSHGDGLVVKNVGGTPARLTAFRPGAVLSSDPTAAGAVLRVGRTISDLLGGGEEVVVEGLGPVVAANEDRVFDVLFRDVYGDDRVVRARFGDGPADRRRKSQTDDV